MPAHSLTARESLRLSDRDDGGLAPPWAVFDPDWYRERYDDAPAGSAEQLLEWHLTQGQALGYSPNLYFDEEWQRQAWPGIMTLIEDRSVASAFDAWCRGPNATRPPHWLFEPRVYRIRYPAMTDEVLGETGFANRYHHYLSHGAAEGRIGHDLFDPAVYLAALDPAEAQYAEAMPYRHYLLGLESDAPERRTSPLFDPEWYRDRYPEAAQAVTRRQYRSALEHYLRNNEPTTFDPSRWFSEAYYLAENPGLADSIGPDGFRNGFAHFLAHGLREGRSPHPDIDLAWYANRDTVRADIEAGRAGDAFTHWVTIGHASGLVGRPPPRIQITTAHATTLYQRRADATWPLFGRHKLDFTHRGSPEISVIMPVRDDFDATMTSLAALRAQYHGTIELILIGCEPASAIEDLEAHLMGATILRFGAILNDTQAREAGLICATSTAVLLLAGGIDLALGSVDNALVRLNSDPSIGAVGARLIQPHCLLSEAGGIIWRDGHLQAYARDASPLAGEANFVRDVDYCSTAFLLARRDVLTSLPNQADGLAGTTHDAADLCTRIREAGFRVIYEPDVLAFLTTATSDQCPDGRAAFAAAHADVAARPAFSPEAIIHARSPRHGRTRVLFVEDSIPLRRIGSGFVRSNDVVRALVSSGASVTVFPMKENLFPLSYVRAELPDTVEVMHDLTSADFANFLAERRDFYDLIWIARTHNLDLLHRTLAGPEEAVVADRLVPVLKPPEFVSDKVVELDTAVRWHLSDFDAALSVVRGSEAIAFARPGSIQPRVVVDTEAVTSVRQAGQAAHLNQEFDLEATLRQEFAQLHPRMHVVAVTEAEAAIIRPHHRGPVTVLGHAVTPTPTPRRFEGRTGILFVGAIHGTDHPNYDGLAWFIDEILPIIEQDLHWETRLTVAGYIAPGLTLDRFSEHPRVTLRGAMADLAPLYDSHRVFVAPARFAAGIPYKVHEAAAFGLPVVATTLLARQLGWSDGEAIGAADASDPAGFAARVVALHRDATLWSRIRERALAHVATELDPGDFASRVARLSQSLER
jgi:glycosyltransferase involved in cell wall biosynthesis